MRNNKRKSEPRRPKRGISDAKFSVTMVALTLAFVVISLGFIAALSDRQNVIQSQQAQLQDIEAKLKALNTTVASRAQLTHLETLLGSLNVSAASNAARFESLTRQIQAQIQGLNASVNRISVNQHPITRDVLLTWTKDLSTQDRFFGGPIVVNQGDTVRITFISNDTVAHTFTLSSPYNFQINASLKGMVNDLTGKTFQTGALNNSPGVSVSGVSGNVTAKGSFVAKYPGIFEYTCIYHVNVGMVGFLLVLPNAAYGGVVPLTTTIAPLSQKLAHVSILNGSGLNVKSPGFAPQTITVVIGVNNTVSWTNNDVVIHTVTASDSSYDSGTITSGQNWNYTYAQAGTYNYFCQYHPWMKGTVVVKGA